ncbi:hypothetical protein BH23PLA1_BH23PLA1_43390 [soil metagenome]
MNPYRDLPFWTKFEESLTRRPLMRASAVKFHQQRKKYHHWRQRRQDRRAPADLRNFERKIHSQFGEDGIIAEIFQRIGEGTRYAVEFGIEDGSECNTRYLFEHRGWFGLLIDGSADHVAMAQARYADRPVRILERFLTVENILDIFTEASVPVEPDLLSIDVDGNDYWLWEKLLLAYRPRVVVIEYNGRWIPPVCWVMPYNPEHCWDGSVYFCASLEALARLGAAHDYQLVGCSMAGGNAFFVRRDQLGDRFPSAERGPRYHYSAPLYARGFGHPIRPEAPRFPRPSQQGQGSVAGPPHQDRELT